MQCSLRKASKGYSSVDNKCLNAIKKHGSHKNNNKHKTLRMDGMQKMVVRLFSLFS